MNLGSRRVVVTRAAHQAEAWVSAFRSAGAEVVRWPLLEVKPEEATVLDPLVRQGASFGVWIFTSTNTVDALGPFLAEVPVPARVAAVGPSTAQALKEYGWEPQQVATKGRVEGLLEELESVLRPGSRCFLPQAEDARPELAQGLRRMGMAVQTAVVYRKRLPPAASGAVEELFGRAPLGWVTFSSPRIVRHFVEVLGPDWPARRSELRALSIGPVTSEALRGVGVDRVEEARTPEASAMVEAMAEAIHRASQ